MEGKMNQRHTECERLKRNHFAQNVAWWQNLHQTNICSFR